MPIHPVRSLTQCAQRGVHAVREWSIGLRDARRLRSDAPWVFAGASEYAESRRALAPYHAEYVTTVSTPLMAISLELAAFLDRACLALAPRRMLDLGSGFSSFVLGRYARAAGAAEVESVDLDRAWLDATRRFLTAHGLPGSGLRTWDDFRAEAHPPYDLVLHDLGGPHLDHIGYRLSVLPEVLELVAPGGVLVLDDANLRALGPAARRLLDERGWRHWSLERLVRDGFGRWALLATPT